MYFLDPFWGMNIKFDKNQTIFYKYFLTTDEKIIWEQRENRELKIENQEEMFINDLWATFFFNFFF